MQNQNVKSKRHALLGALFIAAAERGIDEHDLRDNIAPGLIGRRLSAASERQIGAVLDHIRGTVTRSPRSGYASSIQGLRQEICDLARARWPEWEQSLNAFCRRFGIQRWQWLDVSHGKAVKEALKRLDAEKGRKGKKI